MITAIVGLVLGLFIGWLRLRQMTKNLRTLIKQNNQLSEALNKATVQQRVLAARLEATNAALAELQPVD
ncbi:MAG TPA: hypothetical protein VF123_11500 [Candidatus Sulfotelmatobacter sp.]